MTLYSGFLLALPKASLTAFTFPAGLFFLGTSHECFLYARACPQHCTGTVSLWGPHGGLHRELILAIFLVKLSGLSTRPRAEDRHSSILSHSRTLCTSTGLSQTKHTVFWSPQNLRSSLSHRWDKWVPVCVPGALGSQRRDHGPAERPWWAQRAAGERGLEREPGRGAPSRILHLGCHRR